MFITLEVLLGSLDACAWVTSDFREDSVLWLLPFPPSEQTCYAWFSPISRKDDKIDGVLLKHTIFMHAKHKFIAISEQRGRN